MRSFNLARTKKILIPLPKKYENKKLKSVSAFDLGFRGADMPFSG